MTPAETVAKFFAEHGNHFRRALIKYAGDDVDDLVQDALVVMLRKVHQHDPSRGSLFTWAVTVARNLLKDRRRVVAMRLRHVPAVARDDVVESDPLARIMEAEWSEAMRQAIDELDDRSRSVVEQRLAGTPRGEIAGILNLATDSVAHNLLNRATAHVRRRLDELGV